MSEDDSHKPTVLFLCANSSEAFPAALTAHFDVRVVDNAEAALGLCRTTTFDCYLAYGGDSGVEFWTKLRAFDPNTPFAIVSRVPPASGIEQRFRPGVDIYAAWPCTPYELLLLVQCLMNSAELRSLRARMDEARAISEELRSRLHKVESRIYAVGASIARAEGHMMKAQTLKAFTEAGGARGHFQRYWPETLERVLCEQESVKN